ncbi:hypothetical protein [Methanopyrus kandleri]|uniref:hypothetical protein n=1 Tax=Methanopyrus kandleri TaxID=2320 RepID=UPI0011E52CC9|nr:hypothetical protein [Methanopyrus kandleri]
MWESLVLAMLSVPEDPGEWLGPVLGHPEVLLAKVGRGGGRVGIKFPRIGRTSKSERLPRVKIKNWGYYPEREREERERRERELLSLVYWKVWLYHRMVPPYLMKAFVVLLLGGLGLVALYCLGVLKRTWRYALLTSVLAAVSVSYPRR